jgi:hypothetical protein
MGLSGFSLSAWAEVVPDANFHLNPFWDQPVGVFGLVVIFDLSNGSVTRWAFQPFSALIVVLNDMAFVLLVCVKTFAAYEALPLPRTAFPCIVK